MQKKTKISLGSGFITAGVIFMVLFGSLMIASAEMGNSAGDTEYLSKVILRQSIYAIVGLIAYFFMTVVDVRRIRVELYWMAYFVLLAALLACRVFGATNGAYAWIPLGSFGSIQPSEFTKAFMILFAAKLFEKDDHRHNIDNFLKYFVAVMGYVAIILLIQHDLGSAMVLFVICYCIFFIPDYHDFKKLHRWMKIAIWAVIVLIVIVLSPPVTNFLKNFSDNYMVGRFLAAADPFLYRYDNGYHLVMALVSFASGGLFGMGYTNSIHKYMNFPNPDNDFILPVIVEELGIFGFLAILFGYGMILVPMIRWSFRTGFMSSKIVFLGTFVYFACHFIFNVGGVSGLIPLTGVPLLIVSSGGSSLIACLACVGAAQNEIIRNRKAIEDESDRG